MNGLIYAVAGAQIGILIAWIGSCLARPRPPA